MDTITKTDAPIPGAVPIGTIRRNARSLRLTRVAGEEGQWCFSIAEVTTDVYLGLVVITPGWDPAPIWEREAFKRGILFGTRIEIRIVETCEEFVDAVISGIPLDARHGLRLYPDCPYPIPMHEQEAVAWVALSKWRCCSSCPMSSG